MKREMQYSLDGKQLNREHLIQLIEYCNKTFESCDLTLSFKNNEKQSNISIEELKDYDFTNLTIESIRLSCYTFGKSEKELNLKKNIFSNNYSIDFSSFDDESFRIIKGFVDEWMRKITHKNYKIMKFVNSIFVYFPIYLIKIVLLFFATFYFLIKNDISSPINIIISSISGVLVTVLSISSVTLLRFLFPITEIDIANNHSKNARKFIWSFIVIIGVPTIFLLLSLFIKV